MADADDDEGGRRTLAEIALALGVPLESFLAPPGLDPTAPPEAEETELLGLFRAIRNGRRGARLVREWHGRTHVVSVTEDGFDHDGRRYRSLSHVAQAIAGAHRSGPRSFGLTGTRGATRNG